MVCLCEAHGGICISGVFWGIAGMLHRVQGRHDFVVSDLSWIARGMQAVISMQVTAPLVWPAHWHDSDQRMWHGVVCLAVLLVIASAAEVAEVAE